MNIYDESIKLIKQGKSFFVGFENKDLKIGDKYFIKGGRYDKNIDLISIDMYNSYTNNEQILNHIENLYIKYKYSIPCELNEKRRKKYFKALSIEEIPDEYLFNGNDREQCLAELEIFILCMILSKKLVWQDNYGNWFWKSKQDSDLVLLKNWF